MFVHNVYFWLRDDLTAQQTDEFVAELKALDRIETAKMLLIGRCVPGNPAVVENTYTIGLASSFADADAFKVYMDHPLHQQFIQKYQSYWTKVAIYDFQA